VTGGRHPGRDRVPEGAEESASEAALSLPGVLAAGVLCFILTMNAYATPVLLGGPSFRMVAPVVAGEVLQQSNWPFGAAVSFVLMAVTLALTAGASLLVAQRQRR
jgi:putative spermidine/putrescine transport system permease protein